MMKKSKTTSRLAIATALLSVAMSVARAADVLVVDHSGGAAYSSIQAAVFASRDGDIVLVRAGVYSEEVILDGRSLTVVGEGNPVLVGHLRVQNLAQEDVVQIAGLQIQPPSGPFHGPSYVGALDVRSALGRVRVQDCALRGAYSEGQSPYWSWCGCSIGASDGGAGVLAVNCADIALVDCVVEGGEGVLSAVAVSGYGGDGVVAVGVAHLSVVRTVVRGGQGGLGDDPGNGGAGVRLLGQTTLNIAYSALSGGRAGCWGGWVGTPNWVDIGGDGLVRGAGTTTFDFEGLFFAGELAPTSCVPQHSGVMSFPGSAQSGTGALVSIDGYPNALRAPTIVREGQPWSLEILAPAGELAHVLWAGTTGFRFHPSLEQPRLVGVPSFSLIGPPAIVPANQHLVQAQAPFLLPGTTLGDVIWMQAVAGASGGLATLSSARFLVRLDASL